MLKSMVRASGLTSRRWDYRQEAFRLSRKNILCCEYPQAHRRGDMGAHAGEAYQPGTIQKSLLQGDPAKDG